jgi:glycosyltransferase involved in cell wall biosynthesis
VHGLEAGGRAVTVPYGVDLEAVDRHRSEVDRAEARRRLGIEADAQLVVWPASFSHRKAQLALVEVARRLRTAHPSLVVAMVGRTDDPAATDYGEAVDLYVAAQGLGATARSVPAVVDPWDWLVAADLLVCPSDAESSPYAILEAMAYEVPVVATAVAGIPDVVVPGRTGWLVEPRDLRALADTTSAALSDRPALRARAVAARRLVEQRHAHRPWLDAVASLLRP